MKKFLGIAVVVAAGLAWSNSWAVDVIKQDVYSCPQFFSSTSASGTGGYNLEFMFRWTKINVGSTDDDETEPYCCALYRTEVTLADTAGPSTIYTFHHLTPEDGSPSSLFHELELECPEGFISSGDVNMDYCGPETTTNGNCYGSSLLQSASLSATKQEEPVGLDQVNRPAPIERASKPGAPLLVKPEVIGSAEVAIASLKGQKSMGADYAPLTDIDVILKQAGCEKLAEFTVALASGARSRSLGYRCAAGVVIVQESQGTERSRVGAAPGSRPFEIKAGVTAVGQYYRGEDGGRKSGMSAWKGRARLVVALYHDGEEGPAWVTEVVRKTTFLEPPKPF